MCHVDACYIVRVFPLRGPMDNIHTIIRVYVSNVARVRVAQIPTTVREDSVRSSKIRSQHSLKSVFLHKKMD